MTGIVYDGFLAGFGHLDSVTLTAYAVAPAYVPDPAHVDLDDIAAEDLIGSDTATASLTMSAGEARLDVEDVEIDLSGVEAVGWIVWVDDTSPTPLLVCYEPGPEGIADDPLEITYTDGLLTGSRPE